jgi:hypothetical protein
LFVPEQVVAVDASIWLVQFIKAMRGADGEMLPNAHMIGTFRRVVKVRIICTAAQRSYHGSGVFSL